MKTVIGNLRCELCFREIIGVAFECECGAIVCNRERACLELHVEQQHIEEDA